MNDNKMWALVKEKAAPGLALKRVEIPEVGTNDVKIKIHKTAICGTDVHIYQWNEWAQHTIAVGQTAGHEYVGEIVEVGSGVQDFKVGDIVSGEGHITCGTCRNCLEGHKENCQNAKGVGVNRDGLLCRVPGYPCFQRMANQPEHPRRDVCNFRSIRQCYPHRSLLRYAR